MKPFWKIFIKVALALIDAVESIFGKDDDDSPKALKS